MNESRAEQRPSHQREGVQLPLRAVPRTVQRLGECSVRISLGLYSRPGNASATEVGRPQAVSRELLDTPPTTHSRVARVSGIATRRQRRRTHKRTEEPKVPSKDEAEGRIKEAAGDLTGDKDLQREGKVDQAAGKAKDAVDDASDAVKDKLQRD
jgi:uncharacterized protein YjbJ (UPF0337 family)